MNVRDRIAELRAEEQQLRSLGHTDFLYMMSIDNRALNSTCGRIVEVSLSHGARLLVDRTHRIATPEEIAKFQEDSEARRKEILAGSVLRLPAQFRAGLRK